MSLLSVALGLVLALLPVRTSSREAPPALGERSFDAAYVGTIAPLPPTAKRVEVWIPLPSDTPNQTVADLKVSAPFPATISKDSAGNRVAHFTVEDAAALGGKGIEVRATYRIRRSEVRVPLDVAGSSAGGRPPGDEATYLEENRMVRLTPRVRALAAELAAGKRDAVEMARAFYDYLVENGTYDKSAPGWGRGDSERFCDLKKGNCTDFHSAFMAMARAAGIPVRFVIGFPLPEESTGTAPGYHCWAEFWAPGTGWVPVDASDAAKSRDPRKKLYLFGNLDPDRFEVSRGRDLTLSPRQKDGPVNFLIYPYVEVDGKAFPDTKVRLEYKAG